MNNNKNNNNNNNNNNKKILPKSFHHLHQDCFNTESHNKSQ